MGGSVSGMNVFPLFAMVVECLLTMIEIIRQGRDQEGHRV